MTYRSGGCVLLLTFALSIGVSAQTQNSTSSEPPLSKPADGRQPVADSPVTSDQSRAVAITIISSLVEKSERFKDLRLRAITQARAADAIWEIDQKLARELFLKAWNIAGTVDEEATQSSEEARRKALANKGGGLSMLPPQSSMRSEVLQLAARRDSQLGEMLLDKLKDSEDGLLTEKGAEPVHFDPTQPKLAIAKRLEVALRLLNVGDSKKAIAFAEPGAQLCNFSRRYFFVCPAPSRTRGCRPVIRAVTSACTN